MTDYKDLHDLDEDERISVIGKRAIAGERVAFMVDDDGEKADRYCRKLREKFPRIVLSREYKGPVKGVVTITAGPPESGPN